LPNIPQDKIISQFEDLRGRGYSRKSKRIRLWNIKRKDIATLLPLEPASLSPKLNEPTNGFMAPLTNCSFTSGDLSVITPKTSYPDIEMKDVNFENEQSGVICPNDFMDLVESSLKSEPATILSPFINEEIEEPISFSSDNLNSNNVMPSISNIEPMDSDMIVSFKQCLIGLQKIWLTKWIQTLNLKLILKKFQI